MVSLTQAEAPTHLLPGHAGVGAGVVGLWTNVLAVLVRIITSRHRRGVTGRGLGHLLTFTAAWNTTRVSGAGIPGLEATVHIRGVGLDVARSAVTPNPADALIPAHASVTLRRGRRGPVFSGVRVGGAGTRLHSSQQQQRWDY